MVLYEEMEGHKYPVRIRLTPTGFSAVRHLTKRRITNFFRKVPFDKYVRELFDQRKLNRIDKLVKLMGITKKIP